MNNLNKLQNKRDELWKKINKDMSEYFDTIIEISEIMGYRIRPNIQEDGISDYINTTLFRSVEDLNKWEQETGFECDMFDATTKVANNLQIYAECNNILNHFGVEFKNKEIRRQAYEVHAKTRELKESIKKLIKTELDIIIDELNPNGTSIIIKCNRPLNINEQNNLYDNYLDIKEDYLFGGKHCYKVEL